MPIVIFHNHSKKTKSNSNDYFAILTKKFLIVGYVFGEAKVCDFYIKTIV